MPPTAPEPPAAPDPDGLAARCRAYLEQGPPPSMDSYVGGSLTEIIIAFGARSEPPPDDLCELGELIGSEDGINERHTDAAVRDYLLRGQELVAEVIDTLGR